MADVKRGFSDFGETLSSLVDNAKTIGGKSDFAEATANGRHVLFRKLTDHQPLMELWRVPAEGGEPQKLMEMVSLRDISVHPDGRRITFTGGYRIKMEVWAMENFLPESNAGN